MMHSLFPVILTSIPTMAIRCYVCGPASLDVFPSSSPSTVGTLDQVRPCEEFDSALNKTDFEKDCPENFLGCITQTEGGWSNLNDVMLYILII